MCDGAVDQCAHRRTGHNGRSQRNPVVFSRSDGRVSTDEVPIYHQCRHIQSVFLTYLSTIANCAAFCIPGSGVGSAIAYAFVVHYPSLSWRGPYWLLVAENAVALIAWIL